MAEPRRRGATPAAPPSPRRRTTTAAPARPQATAPDRPGKAARAAAAIDVDAFLAAKRHPLARDIDEVRREIAGVDPSIREDIKWNSVAFRNAHDYFAVVHLRSTDTVQLVLCTGAQKKPTAITGVQVDDPRGLIERWAAKDRCLITLGRGAALRANRPALAALIAAWLPFVTPPSRASPGPRPR